MYSILHLRLKFDHFGFSQQLLKCIILKRTWIDAGILYTLEKSTFYSLFIIHFWKIHGYRQRFLVFVRKLHVCKKILKTVHGNIEFTNQFVISQLHNFKESEYYKAGSTQCVVRIRGASCVNVSKRFVESDTYSLLWCVNLLPNWRIRCDEWTNNIYSNYTHFFHTHDARIMTHDASRIRTTHRVDLA